MNTTDILELVLQKGSDTSQGRDDTSQGWDDTSQGRDDTRPGRMDRQRCFNEVQRVAAEKVVFIAHQPALFAVEITAVTIHDLKKMKSSRRKI
ncbi:hypothetical protein EVAR_61329_1 [Eumeta japonica]|uniref:Uncharacterized protein n=1 Tax=Eumeta variegata TaxID=151549 RepID=A0A4C1Y3K0_EUMVA|nr:hypothetical protein EVAR_61329_1 [Eumeta japonica]